MERCLTLGRPAPATPLSLAPVGGDVSLDREVAAWSARLAADAHFSPSDDCKRIALAGDLVLAFAKLQYHRSLNRSIP